MAGESSRGETRHRSDRDREGRSSSSSHHHNRTISSTTLLLVLSLVLAVLAVMLSLPSGAANLGVGGGNNAAPASGGESSGLFGNLTPKRNQALLAREREIAVREAEVARREAELLIGAPGGVIPPPPVAVCPPCIAATTYETVAGPVQTVVHEVIKEVVKEDSLTPPGWTAPRIEDIIGRELKIAERERDISKREEVVNRREHDASRRENWIMEQLYLLGNEAPVHHVEEEVIYDPPPVIKRKAAKYQELPPHVIEDYAYGKPIPNPAQPVQTKVVHDGPEPASTRIAPFPTPEAASHPATEASPRTTAVEIIREEVPMPKPMPVHRGPPPRGPPRFANGW